MEKTIISTNSFSERFPPPGKMVDVGGYRLHLLNKGFEHSEPTIILDTGLGLGTMIQQTDMKPTT